MTHDEKLKILEAAQERVYYEIAHTTTEMSGNQGEAITRGATRLLVLLNCLNELDKRTTA